MFELTAQAALAGCGRFSRICGAVRLTAMDCATMVQIHLKGLPEQADCGLLFLRIETCRRCIDLSPLKASGCEAILTYLDNSFTVEEVQNAEIRLYASHVCHEALARGTFSHRPCQPHMPDRPPMWPDWRPPQKPSRPPCPCGKQRPTQPYPPLFPRPRW